MRIAPLRVLGGLIVPHPGAQATPFCVSVQVTPLLVPSFVTVAVNGCVAFTTTLAEVSDNDTEIGNTVIEAMPAAPVFVTDVPMSKMTRENDARGNGYGVGGAV